MQDHQFIERRIVTGLIISTDYILSIRKIWNSKLLGSRSAKMIANWCIEFFDQYQTAPGQEIESIFHKKVKSFKNEADSKDVEDILASLSNDYERQDKFNVNYLVDQTRQYFDEQNLREYIAELTEDLDKGEILQAKKNAYSYKPALALDVEEKGLDLSSQEQLSDAVKQAFATTSQPILTYSRQLGEFLNSQLVRGGFVAFMGMEKRGKSFLLMDMAVKAARQKANVAFFQAGDMTQDQAIKRMCIHLTRKPDKEYLNKDKKYTPVRDCIKNQLDTCDLKERECNFGPFIGKGEEYVRKGVTYKDLLGALKDNPDYKPCHNCTKYWHSKWGAVWLRKLESLDPLTPKEAQEALEDFFVDNKRRFRLSTHTSGTLTVSEINVILDLWERRDGFVPDLIVIDFADILASDLKGEFRHQENDKWMRMRALSQRRHALVVTATWTDSSSYEQDILSLKNFSEDKRKYGHVTAMYGLNQDRKGREKEIGILRINQIVIREESFLNSNEVYVLQDLKRGQPCLSSYW